MIVRFNIKELKHNSLILTFETTLITKLQTLTVFKWLESTQIILKIVIFWDN